jgi:N-acyl homoserine lactone hydrolase
VATPPSAVGTPACHDNEVSSNTTAVRRLDLGYVIRPASETGSSQPRVEPVLAYLVRRDEGLILFDTGIGAVDPETEAHYRPQRRDLASALADAGVTLDDVRLVVNCHLHFDHCGGNPRLGRTPILVQSAELATARHSGYTVEELVDFTGATYQEIAGEAEIWPGIWIIPTPGHTDGHQSLVVQQSDGTVVLAGQAHDFASEFASDQLARQATRQGLEPPLPTYQRWMDRLCDFDPRRVLFAHDCSVWEPSRTRPGAW